MYTYGAISTGEFYRQLRRLNPGLRICDFGENGKLAGLYIRDHDGEDYFDICGVDKGFVPEYTEWDQQGHIVKSGWRRVFYMLMQLGLTTSEKIIKVCPGFFERRSQAYVDLERDTQIIGDPIAQKIQKYGEEAPLVQWRDPDTGKVEAGTALTPDQNLDVAADIAKKDPDWKKEADAKDRWFLETWKERGGNSSDKPTY